MESSKRASYYDKTVELVFNHIKKKFDRVNNVLEALLPMVKTDTDIGKPMINISSDIDANVKSR